MNPPIFHIGYHKTGTTWFQVNYYPRIYDLQLISREETQKILLKPRPFDFSLDKVKNQINSNTQKRLVFCDEELSGNIHNGGLNGLLTKEIGYRIKESFPNAIVVLFIRNQIDMIASVYNQYVKKGGTLSIEKYLFPDQSDYHRFPLFSFEHFKYHKLIEFQGIC